MAPPDSFEIFINEQRAELQFYRITLSAFLVRLLVSNPATAEERLQDLKSSVLGMIGRIKTDPQDQGGNRMKQLCGMRGEKFFAELEEALLGARSRMGELGKH